VLVVPRARLLRLCEEFPAFRVRLSHVQARRKHENDFIVKWRQKARHITGRDGMSAEDLADAAKAEAQEQQSADGAHAGAKSWMALKQVADAIGHEQHVHEKWSHAIDSGLGASVPLPPAVDTTTGASTGKRVSIASRPPTSAVSV